ncbi:MAG: efflux RND transporter periplasmic adaptor subunit, partial [Gammaproteobacteria bacterium]|nr:efflux RND transporter periplasmic adaptor subunit [Gammaproteobacteria bacterium]
MTTERKHSFLLAGILSLGIVLWFASAVLNTDPETKPVAAVAGLTESGEAAAVTVQVVPVAAASVEKEVRLQGHTAPNRKVTITAETAGRISEILVERGARVRAGQPIARLGLEDRPSQQRRASALLEQRKEDFDAISKLAAQGHLAGARVTEARANLESARAELDRIQQDIAKTTLTAPFDGIVDDRQVEIGQFVAVRDPVFNLVDDDPLIVTASLAQRDRGSLQVNTASQARLITGEQLNGRVRYISSVANEQTRTFAIEVELPNPDGQLATGISAEAIIPLTETAAHKLSPGWLVRSDDNQIGVFLVNDAGQARFHA